MGKKGERKERIGGRREREGRLEKFRDEKAPKTSQEKEEVEMEPSSLQEEEHPELEENEMVLGGWIRKRREEH